MESKRHSLEKLLTIYNVLTEICQDYSRMTDGYSLSTGDNKFEHIPTEIQEMINERQEFFIKREKVKKLLKTKVLEEFKKL